MMPCTCGLFLRLDIHVCNTPFHTVGVEEVERLAVARYSEVRLNTESLDANLKQINQARP